MVTAGSYQTPRDGPDKVESGESCSSRARRGQGERARVAARASLVRHADTLAARTQRRRASPGALRLVELRERELVLVRSHRIGRGHRIRAAQVLDARLANLVGRIRIA